MSKAIASGRFEAGRRAFAITAVCAGLLAGPTAAIGGAWTLEKGKRQVIASGVSSSASGAFSPHPNDAPKFSKSSASLLFEHGWTDRLTVIGDIEFARENDGATAYARSGFSHFAAGARLKLYEASGFVTSAQLTGRLEKFDTEGFGRPAVEPRLLAGYGFALWEMPAFVDGQAAYRFRAGGADEARIDLTAGLRPWSDWLLLAQSFSTIAVSGGSYSTHKLQGSVVYDLSSRWSVQAGGFATVAGSNALKERGIISALWFRY
ncbi:hypothetical protein [Jiella mangrovi]|uniref:MipA/OmpV family protein n=1 Tax=Jiella mangrovi TaxID=2821407 RepID=A0ABS4BE04_9HYPH|nr:hypothetical protein [Jiella mangrovi]MBP0614195.1 hypothetical protein [Jiella mangrovi]